MKRNRIIDRLRKATGEEWRYDHYGRMWCCEDGRTAWKTGYVDEFGEPRKDITRVHIYGGPNGAVELRTLEQQEEG